MSNLDDIYGRRQTSRTRRCCICKCELYAFEVQHEQSGEYYCNPCHWQTRDVERERRMSRRCAVCGGLVGVGMHVRCASNGYEGL